jgi:carbon starvation protein
MNASILAIIGLCAFFMAFRIYAKYLSIQVFQIDKEIDENTPANNLRDGIDYVPTKKNILFGHHFSSIAGAAPIVGPAVAAIWGWVPAVLWIIFGVIFIGACHDFGALVLSMKNKGQSIALVSEKLLNKRVRTLFLTVIFFLVWMVIAVFVLVIANLFIKFPAAVLPVNFEIIIALIMGWFINKGGKSLTIPSILAQAMLLVMIVMGTKYPISLAPYFGENELMIWIVLLLLYSLIASVLPVWLLLQPRDYINSHQLMVGLGLMITGLIVVSPKVVAPALNLNPEGAPPWFPFLFITIACGAISGFHGLVSGGTSSKQVQKWSDAKVIGYASMLGEGLLALLATLAVTAGFETSEAWHSHYANWNQANGLSAKIGAFVLGSSRFVSGLGIPSDISQTVIAVLIISFAATSLDTACRIQRYVIGELGDSFKVKALNNRYFSGVIAIGSAFLLMISADGGKGGLLLWPLFGATNQMLAALTLTIISYYLLKNKRRALPYIIPTIVILFVTSVGLIFNISNYITAKNWFLTTLGGVLFAAQVWIVIESITSLLQVKRNS